MGDNYYQVDYANEVTKLNAEKQELISFLEDKIKECDNATIVIPSNRTREIVIEKETLQEVLNFINKGGKNEW